MLSFKRLKRYLYIKSFNMIFIAKHLQDSKPQQKISYTVRESHEEVEKDTNKSSDLKIQEKVFDEATETKVQVKKKSKNKVNENKSDMNTSEKIALAKEILGKNTEKSNFKILKSDKGLIERTESSKTILTEDNKELLND